MDINTLEKKTNEILIKNEALIRLGDAIMKEVSNEIELQNIKKELRDIKITIDAVIQQNSAILNAVNKFNQYLVNANEVQSQLSDIVKMHLNSVAGIGRNVDLWNKEFGKFTELLDKIEKKLEKKKQ